MLSPRLGAGNWRIETTLAVTVATLAVTVATLVVATLAVVVATLVVVAVTRVGAGVGVGVVQRADGCTRGRARGAIY
jgi:hypothetical protein